MGNSLVGNGHIQLGSHATINIKKTERDMSGHRKEEIWTVLYIVDGSTVKLTFARFLGKDGDTQLLRFQMYDSIRKGSTFHFFIAEKDLLEEIEFTDYERFCDTKFVNETYNPWGGVTKTNAFFHGSGSKRGLLVVEQKRNNGYRMHCTATVAHYYYAVSSGNVVSQNKIDIGLSMLVHVRLSNDQLVFSVEGPDEHPSSALLYVFQQVSTTRTWKPTSCTQMRRGQSESESEDRDNLLPPARLHGPRQNARGGFLNNENIMGNGNGNIIAPREINFNFYESRQSRLSYQAETESESEDGNTILPARLRGPRQNGGTIIANDGAIRGNFCGGIIMNR